MDAKEFAEMLKSKEVQDAMDVGGNVEDIIKDIEVSETDTIDDVVKKFQKQLKDVVGHFTKVVADTKKTAVEEATRPAKDEENRKILEFKKNNPGMSNPDLVSIMEPLYVKGKDLAACYAIACKALDVDPKTGKAAGDETAAEKTAREVKEAAEAKKTEKDANKTSLKSQVLDDDDYSTGGGGEDKKPKTLKEVIAANANKLTAEGKNPFKESSE